ncbi:MAG: YciI family protein [Pseudomonadota bacterium]
MLFCVFCTDKKDSAHIRADNRPAHLEYLKSFGDKIVAGGATLTDDGEGMTGSLLVVDLEDRAAAEAFAANDPFAKAGLFESVEIRRWRKVIFNTPAE